VKLLCRHADYRHLRRAFASLVVKVDCSPDHQSLLQRAFEPDLQDLCLQWCLYAVGMLLASSDEMDPASLQAGHRYRRGAFASSVEEPVRPRGLRLRLRPLHSRAPEPWPQSRCPRLGRRHGVEAD